MTQQRHEKFTQNQKVIPNMYRHRNVSKNTKGLKADFYPAAVLSAGLTDVGLYLCPRHFGHAFTGFMKCESKV